MDQERIDTINKLCNEVNYMDHEGRKRLQNMWRAHYGFTEALASIQEMAIELGLERGWLR